MAVLTSGDTITGNSTDTMVVSGKVQLSIGGGGDFDSGLVTVSIDSYVLTGFNALAEDYVANLDVPNDTTLDIVTASVASASAIVVTAKPLTTPRLGRAGA